MEDIIDLVRHEQVLRHILFDEAVVLVRNKAAESKAIPPIVALFMPVSSKKKRKEKRKFRCGVCRPARRGRQ